MRFQKLRCKHARRRHPGRREIAGDIGLGLGAGSHGLAGNGLLFQRVAGDHMHADIARAADEFVNNRAVQELEPACAADFPDHDLGDVVRSRKIQDIVGDAPAAWKRRRHAAEPLGEAQRIGDAVSVRHRQVLAAKRLDIERRP